MKIATVSSFLFQLRRNGTLRRTNVLLLVASLAFGAIKNVSSAPTVGDSTPLTDDLIPRMLLFNDPKYSSVSLSPDGQQVAFLAPNEFGISNVYVKCATCKYVTPVTFENRRHISGYQWTGVPNIIIYHQDNDGDENFRLFKINITNPSPFNQVYTINDKPGVKAIIMGNNLRDRRVLIGLNDENPAFHNIYELDLYTNQMRMIFYNQRFPAKIVVDNDLRIKMAMEEASDGSLVFYRVADGANPYKLTSEKHNWVEYLRVPPDDRALTVYGAR